MLNQTNSSSPLLCPCPPLGAALPRGGAEASGSGAEVSRRVPAAARAAAGPVGAGRV